MKIYKTYTLKKFLNTLCFFLVLLMLIIFSKQNFESSKNSLNLFLNNVFPSLFPFILFTEIILNTNIIENISKIFGKITTKIFKISDLSTSPILIGSLCGFPMGAKATSELYKKGSISKKEFTILTSFTNNCNPIFILSTIGISMYKNIKIGIFLLFCHYITSIIVGIIISNKNNSSNSIKYESKKISNFKQKNDSCNKLSFELLTNSILNTFKTLALILGFIVIFNLISSSFVTLLNKSNFNKNVTVIISSIFEMTNGINQILILDIPLKQKLIISSFLTSFSGFCIIFQIYSYFYKFEYKLLKLISYKLLNGIISSIIAYILLSFTNILNIIA